MCVYLDVADPVVLKDGLLVILSTGAVECVPDIYLIDRVKSSMVSNLACLYSLEYTPDPLLSRKCMYRM